MGSIQVSLNCFHSFRLTGLGPGGLTINDTNYDVFSTCLPGSSHGGKAQSNKFLQSGPAYDKDNLESLLGGSGGEIFLI